MRGGPLWRVMAGAACALAAGGCDYIFRIDHLPDVGNDAHADSAKGDSPTVDDGRPLTDSAPPLQFCSNPILDTTFSNAGTPCLNWGTMYGSNGATTVGGPEGLVITPRNQLDSVGGCFSMMNKFVLGTGGVYALLGDAARGLDTYTALTIHNVEYQIKVTGDGLAHFQTSGSQNIGVSAPFAPPMWFRIVPIGDSLTGEFSPSGTVWTSLGNTGSITLPPTVDIEVSAGVNGGYAGGTGTFRRLVICP